MKHKPTGSETQEDDGGSGPGTGGFRPVTDRLRTIAGLLKALSEQVNLLADAKEKGAGYDDAVKR